MSRSASPAARVARILTFRADLDDYRSLDRRYLAAGLVVTWIVGMGRYWDNPRVEILQKAGLGSVVYVLVLAALLWVVGLGLRPRRWSYSHLLTFVTLTAAPGLLYAIPVERVLSPDGAREANMVFLAVVATWRVALYGLYLRRYAELPFGPWVIQLLLPLTFVVSALAVLNLERAVFDLMAGVGETTPADRAYGVLVGLTIVSLYTFPFLLLGYFIFAAIRRNQTPDSHPDARGWQGE